MITCTAIILAKNAESVLADCIESVRFCDEIIVLDDASTDRTVEIATHLGVKVISFSADSFAKRRNYALTKAKGKWVLYIDSDERVTPELASSITYQVSNSKNEYVAFRLLRKNFYFGKHEWPTIEKLERLFKKDCLQEWYGEVHETPKVTGKIGELSEYLLHYTHQDLTSMVEKTASWSEIEAKIRFNANHPPMSSWRFFRVMFTGFWDSYIKQKGYKAGTAGLVESMYQSFSMFITYARLWEMQESTKKLQ